MQLASRKRSFGHTGIFLTLYTLTARGKRPRYLLNALGYIPSSVREKERSRVVF